MYVSRLLAGAAIVAALGTVPVRATVNLGQIMPLGDSITYGVDPDAPNGNDPGGYRTEFYARLSASGYGFTFVGSETDNPSDTLTAAGEAAQEGHPGYIIGRPNQPATTAALYNNLSAATQATVGSNFSSGTPYLNANVNPSDVLLMAGINNFLLNYGAGESEVQMDELVGALFASQPGTHLFLSTLLPYAGNQEANLLVQEKVVQFNAYLPTIVSEYQSQGYAITLVDTYDEFVLPTGAANPALLSSDGLHPSAAGYTVLGDAFADAVLSTAPEPTSATLLAIGCAALIGRRRARCWVAAR